ncbi:hypothetical protein CHLRE_02g093450v5 [Chlamydomonas reinhardtii]|uniref:fructose-bisphosphate aldolase n=1 Tax=Chlamydomonas reinhardtii TaxID=3055 RepID=A8I9H5_CHLRE|nr:uncharacterized protein CHLRE_02g093450v5 [Chlamydomonas reinhardtii]PNW86605.1 hypothetical protein CHLRE_02g093450v5 [Chlamydomonas reinhardtii]|eukprot:XP_001701797.1 fructose-1,6-bisphosphate aldolase [Chlamydomonas reinhardtii]
MASPLAQIAAQLAAPGKGLLASDESTGTIGKRLEKAGLPNTEDIRRSYRELYYTTPGMGQYISGVIMFKETLYQSTKAGRPFVEVLAEQGILAGIKVDEGLEPLAGAADGETHTKGLEGLEANCREYARAGAKFAKWRATLKVTDTLPSALAVERNADELAQYARICQNCGLVPVVEPEILIDGNHSQERFGQVTEQVIGATVAALWRHGVELEGCLLKPQMVIPGADAEGGKVSAADVARCTVAALRRVVPPAIPGIMFLSGGQTEEEATINLDAVNREAQAVGRCPWVLSFSFGRALQASVLKLWSSDQTRVAEAQQLALALARVNSEAALGNYNASSGSHPSTLGTATLHETFRGWNGQPAGNGAAQ